MIGKPMGTYITIEARRINEMNEDYNNNVTQILKNYISELIGCLLYTSVNNEAVLIAAEFTKYGSIDEAHNDGVYENLMNYSSLNAIRIRLVDKKYNISVDTYAVDTGKTMINSKVITVYDSPKTCLLYTSKADANDIAMLDNLINERAADGWELVTYDYMATSMQIKGAFVVTFRKEKDDKTWNGLG